MAKILRNAAGAVTASIGRIAIAWLGQAAIRSETIMCVDAPEMAGVGWRHRRIVIRLDEHALPAKVWTQRWMINVESFGFRCNHFNSPFAADIMARFTATRAN